MHDHHFLQQWRELLELVDRRPKLQRLGMPVARINRIHRQVLPMHRLDSLNSSAFRRHASRLATVTSQPFQWRSRSGW